MNHYEMKELREKKCYTWNKYRTADNDRRQAWFSIDVYSNYYGTDAWANYIMATNYADDAWNAYVVACKEYDDAKGED